MKLTLTDRIMKQTELSHENVISILQSGTLGAFKFFPDEIMTGKFANGKIKSVINPPTGFADPFKSRVNGIVKNENGRTKIELKINLGWIIIGFYIIWYSLILLMIFGLIFQQSEHALQSFGILIVFILLPLGLGKLKLSWDKRRLEDWIDEKLKTSS